MTETNLFQKLIIGIVFVSASFLVAETFHAAYVMYIKKGHQCEAMLCFETKTTNKAYLQTQVGASASTARRFDLWYCSDHRPLIYGSIGGTIGFIKIVIYGFAFLSVTLMTYSFWKGIFRPKS